MPPPALARAARRAGAQLLMTARALSGSAHLAASPPSPAAQLAAIRALREASGAPMSDVKAALVEADWDADGAFGALRKRGLAAAQKKACVCGRVGWARVGGGRGRESRSDRALFLAVASAPLPGGDRGDRQPLSTPHPAHPAPLVGAPRQLDSSGAGIVPLPSSVAPWPGRPQNVEGP